MSFDYHIKVITTFTKLTIGKNLLAINLYMKKINIIFRYMYSFFNMRKGYLLNKLVLALS